MKKKISVSDLSPHSVVASMSQALNVPLQNGKYEYSIELPPDFGQGAVRSYAFRDGFGVIHTSYKLSKDFFFQLEKGTVHPLKLIFNVGDLFHHKLEKAE